MKRKVYMILLSMVYLLCPLKVTQYRLQAAYMQEAYAYLVTPDQPLPEGYVPTELVMPDVDFLSEGTLEKNHLSPVAAQALTRLFEAAEQESCYLVAVSGYRSYERQHEIYTDHAKRYGKQDAALWVALPGCSEHQTGLAMDVSAWHNGFALNEAFGECKEGKWLAEHAHEYGYIIRYPKGKVHITGYGYEPWHIRYVGETLAAYLYTHRLTLEEGLVKLGML